MTFLKINILQNTNFVIMDKKYKIILFSISIYSEGFIPKIILSRFLIGFGLTCF